MGRYDWDEGNGPSVRHPAVTPGLPPGREIRSLTGAFTAAWYLSPDMDACCTPQHVHGAE